MTPRTILAAALTIGSTMAAAVGPAVTAQDPSTTTLVERAGRYVEAYEQAFAGIVCEENQLQTLVRADGRVRKTRRLRSDFLLIKTGPAWAQVFRDVLEVDGKPLRNRADRLRKLFLESPRTAVEQASAIALESGRHNIGMARTGNSPLLPLIFLHPKQSARSRFSSSGDSLTFEEFQIPSLLRSNKRDLLARGSFVIDRSSGQVRAAELTAPGPPGSYSASLAVRYVEEPELKLMVPVDARERYWFAHKPKDDRLEVDSTYANFRRFTVTVDERIKIPK